MSDLIKKYAPELAFDAVTAGLACYGLQQIYPAPGAHFLLVIGTVTACAGTIIRQFAPELAKQLYPTPSIDPNYGHLLNILHLTGSLVSSLFVRYVAQRLGCQVPGFLQTFGYLYFAERISWITKSAVNFCSQHYREKPVFDMKL
jgi:hypothetical protein